jgi:hypothetical protein
MLVHSRIVKASRRAGTNSVALSILEERPFYFIVALWGAEFRSFFINLLLPTLLAPGNIPSLVNGSGSRFLIATTRSDWIALQDAPLMAVLQSHIQVVAIDIPEVSPGDDKFVVMTRAHKLAADLAIEAKAFGIFLCPDTLLSDGTVRHLQDRAAAGAKVVLIAALRHDQEGFLADLYALPRYALNKPLVFSPRELMELSLCHLHPQVVRRDFDADEFAIVPGFCIWRAPDRSGLILHNTRWGPLLFSYGDLNVHHSASNYAGEGHVSVDDDYVYRNYGTSDDIQVVTDSDEITYISLTSTRELAKEATTAGSLSKRVCLRINAFSGIMDPLQWKLFRLHIRLHTGELTAAWRVKEAEIDEVLKKTIRNSPSPIDRICFRLIIMRYILKEFLAGNSKPLRAALRLR